MPAPAIRVITSLNEKENADISSAVILLPITKELDDGKPFAQFLAKRLNHKDQKPTLTLIQGFAKHIRLQKTPRANKIFSFDERVGRRLTVALIETTSEMFFLLKAARDALKSANQVKPQAILVDLSTITGKIELVQLAHAFSSAWTAMLYEPPKYRSKKKTAQDKKDNDTDDSVKPDLILRVASKALASVAQDSANMGQAITTGTNLVRRLTVMATNDLTNKKYVDLALGLAREEKLKTEFLSVAALKKLGAGAFLAVAQGSAHPDAGILKLHYTPKKTRKMAHVVLVGKGITFDTGGVNVKTGTYMYGMNGDMGGSAVALALVLLAVKEQWPFKVSSYLAIADNAISNVAYRPNDVVTSYSGKTIEIIHTDAEGRMILADTLSLASEEKPDLIMDFATLTGACVRAIGTTYSGAFTNQSEPKWHADIIEAGRASGERVWTFPLDKDFAEPLESTWADIKQCRLTGGVDHIEAASFLKEFVAEKIPWIHIDLSAVEHDGGLAHIDDKFTGFGVGFAAKFLLDWYHRNRDRH